MYTKWKQQFCNARIMSHLKAVERRLDQLLVSLKGLNYDALSEGEYLRLCRQVARYFRYARKRKGSTLYFKALSAKLGGEVSHHAFEQNDFRQFIESNALMHKMQTLRMKLEAGEEGVPMIRIALPNGESISLEWSSFQKRPLKCGGYIFTYFDHEVFRTNEHYKLIDDYILTYRGITQYHPEKHQELIAFDKRNPKEWNGKFIVEIWTLLKDEKGEKPTLGIGDHCHILMKDPEGFVYSMGKFGTGEELKLKDYMTLFGAKKGRYICPDFCSYICETSRNHKKTAIEVTKEQFEALFAKLSEDKKEVKPTFTILKKNCASYVQHTLKKVLDLNLDSELYLPHFALRALIPKRLYNGVLNLTKRLLNKCPKWLQRAFYFIPPLYISTLIAGSILRCFKADLTFKDILIKPWNLTIYSPIALRESLENVS